NASRHSALSYEHAGKIEAQLKAEVADLMAKAEAADAADVDLNALVEPDARGDPMSPLRWTCKSLRRLADELSKLGHKISHTVVGELLKKQKFSLQANSKTREGADNPDRDAQFRVCVQRRLACSAGDRPAGAKVRRPVVKSGAP